MGFGLTQEEVAQAKVDKYIVDRLRAVLKQLKQCRTEDERTTYHIVLASLAPERDCERSRDGMLRAVSERVGVQRGARYFKGEKRPYAFDAAVTQRGTYDEAAKITSPLQVGDCATSRGRPCTVLEIDYEADKCKLLFRARNVEVTKSYECIYKGREAPQNAPFPTGSARLRRAPPSLRPKGRETRHDAKLELLRPKVEELYNMEGARSPSQHDRVQRRIGTFLFETEQRLIIYAKQSSLYKLFLQRYPAHSSISYSLFKRLRPWYVWRAKEVTCCCKQCDNFKHYQKTMRTLAQLLEEALCEPATADGDDAVDDECEAEATSWEGHEKLKKLVDFCKIESKSEMVKSLLCKGAMEGAGKQVCIDGVCTFCGFKKLWSEGLRKLVVDESGDVLGSAPAEFQSELEWVRSRNSSSSLMNEGEEVVSTVKRMNSCSVLGRG